MSGGKEQNRFAGRRSLRRESLRWASGGRPARAPGVKRISEPSGERAATTGDSPYEIAQLLNDQALET